MSLSHIITASRGRLAQLIGGSGNNQFVRASDLNKVIDTINTVIGGVSVPAITDSSGGTAGTAPYTIAAITEVAHSGSADTVPVKNAISKLSAEINALRTALVKAGIIS